MKIAGAAVIVIFFAIVGLKMNLYEKSKILYSDKLVLYGEEIFLLLSSTAPDTDEIFKCLSENTQLSDITADNIKNKSPLTESEKNTAAKYIASIGKYDLDTQLALTCEFIGKFKSISRNYSVSYKSRSKICFAFSISTGIIISLLLL